MADEGTPPAPMDAQKTTPYPDDNNPPAGQPPANQPQASNPPPAAPYPNNAQNPPPAYYGQPQPGAYPPGAYPPGAYPPGAAPPQAFAQAGFGMAAGLAQNLPNQPVVWMPTPTESPPVGCPPGLEYLITIDQLLVHQQIEVFELITNFETENRYRVKNSIGQQIYFAKEESNVLMRQFCGPGRSFVMSITDNSQNEVIRLERPLRCYCNCSGLTCYCCCSCCAPNIIEIQAPPGTVVGYVKQEALGILRPWFSIQDAEGETVLRIKGPILGCSCYADANFEVLSVDAQENVGRISKQWGGLAREYFTDADNFGIQFPMDLDVKMKAVMLGAVFLIDFMFFETAGANRQNRRR